MKTLTALSALAALVALAGCSASTTKLTVTPDQIVEVYDIASTGQMYCQLLDELGRVAVVYGISPADHYRVLYEDYKVPNENMLTFMERIKKGCMQYLEYEEKRVRIG